MSRKRFLRFNMRAITYDRYGGPDVLRLEELSAPTPAAGEVLLRVRAASVNPYDFHYLRGEPLFMRMVSGLCAPKFDRLGRDVAGIVEAVGEGVFDLRVGDEVYGGGHGTFAEYATAKASELALRPAALKWTEAAACPMAGVTALEAMRVAGLEKGQHALVNGASGGIGHLLVQMAKERGCEVTAVCSTQNVGWVKALGADAVIDYTQGSSLDAEYDVIIDMVSDHSVRAFLQAVRPGGAYVWVGAVHMGRVLGPIGRVIRIRSGPSLGRRGLLVDGKYTRANLDAVSTFVEAGVRPVIEREVPLPETGAAIAHVEAGHTKGKTVVVP